MVAEHGTPAKVDNNDTHTLNGHARKTDHLSDDDVTAEVREKANDTHDISPEGVDVHHSTTLDKNHPSVDESGYPSHDHDASPLPTDSNSDS